MSKYVKNLMVREIAQRLEGVQDALLVNVIGIDANQTVALRRELREKDIHLLVVKNGMARRATEGTSLAPAFAGTEGTLAVMWGGEDFISLVKEVTRLDKSKHVRALPGSRWRDGRRAVDTRTGAGNCQVAQSTGTVEHLVGTDPVSGRPAGFAAHWSGRGVGQPD